MQQQLPKISQTQVERELCKRSFFFFVQYFWDTIIAEKPIWNWHIEYICDELQQIGERVFKRQPKLYDYYIFNVPPGSSKSTIISEMYPLCCWTNDATQRFICGSYASTPAEDLAEKCFNIYKSDKFLRLFPELVKNTSGGKTHFKNGLLGERYTTSTGSGITGVHAHQKIVDDPMTPSIANSKTEREAANKWISETLSSRNVDADVTVTILVMQRLHEMDTTGYLLKNGLLRIFHVCIPAELSEDVKPSRLKDKYVDGLFDPVRKSRTILEALFAELGSYGFAGQLNQRPVPAGGGLIKKNWFTIVDKENLPFNYNVSFQGDTAYTEKQQNDPSGFTAYFKHDNNIYITNNISVRKEFPDLCFWLPLHCAENGYTQKSIIRIEPKASGKSLVQQLRKESNLNIVEDFEPEGDKVSRVNTCSPKMEGGRIFLLRGHWNEDYLTELAAFPKGEHDEAVDNLTAIITRELINGSNSGQYNFG